MNRKKWAVAGAAAISAAALVATPALAVVTPGHGASPSVQKLHAEALNGTLSSSHGLYHLCSANGLACQASIVTTRPGSHQVLSTTTPAGIGATDLESAYQLTHAANGKGTITILDAAYFPPATLETDMNTYRKQYGIKPCTIASGCFTVSGYKSSQLPKPPTSTQDKAYTEEIGVETTLDVEMASAACPTCKIVELQLPLVDGLNGSVQHIHNATSDFGVGVKTAVSQKTSSVSISYGFPADAFTDTKAPAKSLDQVGTAIMAASADGGYVGTSGTWPQTLRTVTSVGGTELSKAGNARGWNESAWADAGSSCSPRLAPAFGQPKSVSQDCKNMRADSDVSAASDNIAMYDTYAPYSNQPYNWITVGGTSASSPLLAGIYARTPGVKTIHGPNVTYADPATDFNDITTGSNGSSCVSDGFAAALCQAGAGWDGPTGVGTPIGLKLFTS